MKELHSKQSICQADHIVELKRVLAELRNRAEDAEYERDVLKSLLQ